MSANLGFSHEFVPGSSDRTLLLLHGTGGNEQDLIPLGRYLDPEAALLSPRGQVLENGMPRYFRRLAEGVFDQKDLIHRTNELAEFLQQAAAHYRFDQQKLRAVGYSNGANIAGALLLLRPEALRGAALLRPMVPLLPERLPDLTSISVLVIAGNQDPIISLENARELVELLRRSGADVTVCFENAGHALINTTVETTKCWLIEARSKQQANEPHSRA
jgi:phospholipase/carboxylesterase